jgi:hypothetical protein
MIDNTTTPYNYTPSYIRRFLSYLSIVLGIIGFLALIFTGLSSERSSVRGSLFLVDVSLSMTVEDVILDDGILISRMSAAQDILKSIPHDRPMGLMTFAETAKLQLPLSEDKNIWDEVVSSLEPIRYGASTDITTALSSVGLIYGNTPLDVYVLTDGERTTPDDVLSGSTLPSTLRITFIWIGSEAWGKIVNNYDGTGQRVYKKYDWKEVLSKLDVEYLGELSEIYNARYTYITTKEDIKTLDEFFTREDTDWMDTIWSDRLYYVLAWFLILLWCMIPDYRLKKTHKK